MLLQAAARSQPEDLRVVLVGDVEPFHAADWPSGDWVLAPLQRLPKIGFQGFDCLRGHAGFSSSPPANRIITLARTTPPSGCRSSLPASRSR
jgi:hypothetical protein